MIVALPFLAVADAALVAWAATHLNGPIGPINFAHVALTLAALAICVVAARKNDRRLDPADMVIGSAFGPCGIVGMAMAGSVRLPLRRVRKFAVREPRAMEHEGPTGSDLDIIHRALEDRITYPEAEQVESLAVTLRFGEQAARQKALQSVVRSFEPRLSPLIAVALSDKDQAIRALAAAASAQISHDVAQAFAEMESKIASRVDVEELVPLVLSIASHGCNDVLLPRTQQLILCRASRRYLAAHLADASSRAMEKDMRAALADIDKILAPAERPPAAKLDAAMLVETLA